MNDKIPLWITLLAKFFSKERNVKDVYLDSLYKLDDIWGKVYQENRIKSDFTTAKILANEEVINFVFNSGLVE